MKRRIAVIDDDKNIIKLLKYELEKEGYKVYPYSSGKEILEESKHRNFDLILLDLMLPDIKGWDVYKEMNKNEDTKNIPVIILTGKGLTGEEEVEGLKLGAEDYITKPFKNNVLKERVEKVLERKKQKEKSSNTISIGNTSLHYEPMEIAIGKRKEILAPEECKVLRILMKHQGRLVEYNSFYKKIWGYNARRKALSRVIEKLRKKLGDECKYIIKTKKNTGYYFERRM